MRMLTVVILASIAALTGCGEAALCARQTLAQRIGLPVGARARLHVGSIDILDECDRPARTGLVWASSDTTRARVDATGTVRGVAPGRVEIVARAGRSQIRIPLAIVPTVARVEIIPRDTSVLIGDTVEFRATAFGTSEEPLPSVRVAVSARDMWKAAGHGDDSIVYATEEPGQYPALFVNRLSLRAWREGAAYVVAEVVGMADSALIRVRR